MNVLRWLSKSFSSRARALTTYRRGMARAHRHEHQGAIDDYTAMIDLPDTPANMKAMALYNRALAYVAANDEACATADLTQILSMSEAPANVRTEARRKLLRMKRRSDESDAC